MTLTAGRFALTVFVSGLSAATVFGQATFDVLVKGGTVYDGSGGPPRQADVGIRGDKIARIGNLSGAKAATVVEARGLAVAPGFINMLSWSTESLIADGRSQGEIRQGITTQIFGEGFSMGPLNDALKKLMKSQQTDFQFEIEWTTLAEYLAYLEKRGVSQNVASFIGATTIRSHVIGFENRRPTPEELDRMRELVRKEMEAGALGIGSSLIYALSIYASTEELIELCKVAAKYKGKYISHMRSEADALLEAVDELIRIARGANVPAEIYHLKAAGEANWPKMDAVIAKVEDARRRGLKITADMYTYPAGGTSLAACIPPWAHEGGPEALLKRLGNAETRTKIAGEMRRPGKGWENICLLTGSPERVLLMDFGPEAMKPMNIKKQLKLPWVSFGSDGASMAPEGVFLKSSTHPRSYGNFARLLGKYVRDEKVISLTEAIRRLTRLPAENLALDRRGRLKPGMFADVVVFDPAVIADKATFEKPHQYSVGMRHVFVNGVHVLKDGEHTGAKPGRALAGPGKVAAAAR